MSAGLTRRHFEVYSVAPYVEIVGDSPIISFFFSDAGPLEDEMRGFIHAVDTSPDEVTFMVGAPLREIIDATIGNYRMGHGDDEVVMTLSDQPIFDAIRAALCEAIAKIDAITYVPSAGAGAPV